MTSITIPNSVTSIGDEAFSGCSSLTSVKIPNSVKIIGDYSFQGCKSLTSITIPNSVTSIGEYTFCGCWSLTSIAIPNSVTKIGNSAFEACSALTRITIPNSVTSIGEMAFSGCSSLTRITIPNSVTQIGEFAFMSCYGLTSIAIPNSVIQIDRLAFEHCHHLTSVVIPDSVKSIGELAFADCTGLKDVNVSYSVVKKIDVNSVFKNTPWLSKVGTCENFYYVLKEDGNLTIFGDGTFDSNDIKEDIKTLVKFITIPADTTSFKFKDNSLLSVLPTCEKIVNQSTATIDLPWSSDSNYSWCNINNKTDPICSISKGTAVKINKKLSKKYTIAFNGNGATSGKMNSIQAQTDKSIAISKNTFAKKGYVFKRWKYTLGENSYYLDDGASINLSLKDCFKNNITTLTLSAEWEKDYSKYTIVFDGNGATGGSMSSLTAEAGKSVSIPSNAFTRTGYQFKNWQYIVGGQSYTVADGSSFVLSENTLRSNDITSVTLVVQWEEEVYYDIVFDSNGGTGTMATIKAVAGQPVTIPKNTFTYSWKKFKHWVTRGSSFEDGDTICFTKKDLEKYQTLTVTLIALWVPDYDSIPVNQNVNSSTLSSIKSLIVSNRSGINNGYAYIRKYSGDREYVITLGDENLLQFKVIHNGEATNKYLPAMAYSFAKGNLGSSYMQYIGAYFPVVSILADSNLAMDSYVYGDQLVFTVDKSLSLNYENNAGIAFQHNANVYYKDAIYNWNSLLLEKTGYSLYDLGFKRIYGETSVINVTLDKDALSLTVGGSPETLVASIIPADATNQNVNWLSSDESIASVDDNGTVTPKSAGTAYISATTVDGGFIAICTVTVTDKDDNTEETNNDPDAEKKDQEGDKKESKKIIAVSGVKLNKKTASIVKGKTLTLKATVKPSDATNKGLIWKSSNKKVATVNKNGIVKGIKKGTAIITAITKDGSKTATCKITVTNPVKVKSIKFKKKAYKVKKKKTVILKTTFTPKDATNKEVTYKSSDKKIATVDKNGKVKGLKKGIVTITVTTKDGKHTATCKVTVK